MKLIDALNRLQVPQAENAPQLRLFLACGFTPLHLQTFIAAETRALRFDSRVSVETGLFGDLCGSLERLDLEGIDSLAVVIEWGDLDTRLAIRTLGGWRPSDLADILESSARTAARLQRSIAEASRHVLTVVCMPTLPLSPMFPSRPSQASSVEMQLRRIAAELAASLSEELDIRIVSAQALDEVSPPGTRYDVKSDVVSGFPYSLPHASAVGKLLGGLICNRQAKKGLITDLDDTLWAGILGEDGVDGISWHLDHHSHMHGLYQQFVSSLAGSGVLIGVASKNDSELVARAFARRDMLLSNDDIFPFETHWARKSESVQRILKTWNVGADTVLFIDDSPMEVAEVKEAFPEMECIVFPKGDYQGVWRLMKHLRDVFGKPYLTGDDALRLRSIRDSGAWRDAARSFTESSEDFLKTAAACVCFEPVQPSVDARAFDLVNKTNQFNLNGKRLNESEWKAFPSDPATICLTVSYRDKFGPLGKIAVILGERRGHVLSVNCWVMSCRAFSRRIEHQCVQYLFDSFGVDEIEFDYQATPRNGPLQEFFVELLEAAPAQGMRLSREQFAAKVPPLFHRIEGIVNV